ncbi:MAG: histidinol phosphate phosphatase [Sphingomonadaceae bacterium]|nr:histidinol phosphate phosphatase [Sphingomonadaceae bacterium]
MLAETDIALAHALADAAGEAIRPFFRAAFEIEAKADATPVTEADRAAEAAMRRLIEAERPSDGIIGEEYGIKESASGRHWVLDPIDGTRSFIAGRPIFGTLIALAIEGWPALGVIDQPIARERWIGAMGRKTELNGVAARTRARASIGTMRLATTSPHCFAGEDVTRFMGLVAAIHGAGGEDPIYGGDCYNYGLVASGHLDLVVESGLKLHDFAALVPVVESAGGRMCDWRGEPLDADSAGDVIAIGDPARLDEVLDALRGAE